MSGQTPRQEGPPPEAQLPVEMTGFVGREVEVARLVALLGSARLVTVTGPGGVGKSRLALRAAAQAGPGFADGVCLVELSGLREPRLLADTVATALGLSEPRHRPAAASYDTGPDDTGPDEVTAQGTGFDTVLADLRERNLLLILDTCEHLIDACAMLAEAVITRAPLVTLLVTSREPLDVLGENACPVGPLAVPEPGAGVKGTAVDLFQQRASAAVPGFVLRAEDLPHAIRICAQLNGIPLAVELAAVRLRALPLADLADRLEQRLPLLTSGAGPSAHRNRHKTLRDAIGWSYDLCTPAEQAMWGRLSVFSGPFTMAAAEDVCGTDLDPGLVVPTIIRLVDKSLLVRADAAGSASGEPARYLMLDTVREYGAERLAPTKAAGPTRKRLLARYLSLAVRFSDHFLDEDQLARLRELRREHDNIRAALEYGLGRTPAGPTAVDPAARATDRQAADRQAADGVALASVLALYWRARGLAREGDYWLGRAVEAAPANSTARGRALLARGRLRTTQGRTELALADAAEARHIADERGDGWLAAHARLVENGALCVAGNLTASAEAGNAAERQLTALGDQLGLIDLDTQLTYLALLQGDTDRALEHVEHGLQRLDGSRERWLHVNLYMLASLVLYQAGRDVESAWMATRALQVKHEVGDVLGVACTLEVLGWLAARAGRYQRAAWLLGGADLRWARAGGRLAATAVFEERHAEVMAQTERALGPERFAELFARARRHPLDELIAFARGDADDPAGDEDAQIHIPSQLTAREREIATLVAGGLSNRQIAEKLFISRRTVDAHLEHIFGKLRITSRVMLAIQLREHSASTDAAVDSTVDSEDSS